MSKPKIDHVEQVKKRLPFWQSFIKILSGIRLLNVHNTETTKVMLDVPNEVLALIDSDIEYIKSPFCDVTPHELNRRKYILYAMLTSLNIKQKDNKFIRVNGQLGFKP